MIQRLRVYRSLIGATSSSSSSSSLINNDNNTVRRLLENINNTTGRNAYGHRHGHNNNAPHRQVPFDGVVLSLDQLLDTFTGDTTETTTMGRRLSSLIYDNNMRIICQLEPECANDASDQLRRLAVFLDSSVVVDSKTMTRTRTRSTSTTGSTTSMNNSNGYHGHNYHRPILDMVIIRAPQQMLDDYDNVDKTIEYLSSTLPAASKFLESIVPGSVTSSGSGSGCCSGLFNELNNIGDINVDIDNDTDNDIDVNKHHRSNAHGRPVRRHVHGVSHHLPGIDLQRLTEIADIFPPTRFALDPTNLRSSSSNLDGYNTTDNTADDGHNMNSNVDGAPSRSNNTYGLSREIEAVIQNTDIIRVSPSTFQPSFFESNNSNNSNVNNNDNEKVIRHGLFGTGTLFGEVWCAQELDGAHETYVICDDDDDNDNDNDTDNVSNEEEDDCIYCEEKVTNKTEDDLTTSSFSSLAGRIHTAFEESANWRAGAETRREEESKEATIAAANKYHASGHFSSWMQGRYSPEVIESARVLGLITTTTDLEESPIIIMDDDDNNNDGSPRENRRLTTGMIKERWHALAFQSHPDTADDGSSSTIMNDKITFSVLRQHYLTLIAAARQDERKNNRADEEDASS